MKVNLTVKEIDYLTDEILTEAVESAADHGDIELADFLDVIYWKLIKAKDTK